MDALPIQEVNTTNHKSRIPNVMHACGHDGHTASLLGAAAVLVKDQSWSGTINLIFQPAEEDGTGAKAMIRDGLFERFPMERIFAFHNMPGYPVGTAAFHTGPSMAAGGDWNVTLSGVAGHAAAPHNTRDPITAAGHLIVALNSIVSRNVDPLDTVALTIATVQGGTVSNQIPDTATLTGTLRTFDPSVRKEVIARMGKVIEGTAAAMGVTAKYKINSTGQSINDSKDEKALAIAAAQEQGLDISWDIRPFMGGDDFSFLLEGRKGAYIHLGNGPIKGTGRLHNGAYEFEDALLGPAIGWLASVARHSVQAA
jgi:hippurate hydrolase